VRIRALVDSVNSSGVYQPGGTARIDNVLVSGVPAPGAVALLGLAGLAARRRRR
jgi:MYXO-CTERM domain-containing protein